MGWVCGLLDVLVSKVIKILISVLQMHQSTKVACLHVPLPVWFTHRVPLSSSTLLFESGKLPPVVDGNQELPDQQSGQAEE